MRTLLSSFSLQNVNLVALGKLLDLPKIANYLWAIELHLLECNWTSTIGILKLNSMILHLLANESLLMKSCDPNWRSLAPLFWKGAQNQELNQILKATVLVCGLSSIFILFFGQENTQILYLKKKHSPKNIVCSSHWIEINTPCEKSRVRLSGTFLTRYLHYKTLTLQDQL